MKTNKEYQTEFRDHGIVTVPKGTRVTNQTACGIDKNIFFVDEFSWVPTWPYGTKKTGLIHDAIYYGISVPEHYVDRGE